MDQNQRPVGPYKGGRVNGWPKGMDNRSSNVDIPADRLRDVVNGDVLVSGKVRRRRGISQVVADAGAHSVFSNGSRMLWATPNTLKSCTPNFIVSTLLTNVRLALPLSYVDLNGEIYLSNESINGKVNVLGAYEPYASPPSVAPVCASTDASATKSRQYQVTCTFVLASGEETGAPLGAKVLCGDSPIIALSSIPQSSDSRVVFTRIYVTDIDGDVFYHQANVPAGLTTYTVAGPFGMGKKLDTQFMVPPPPGQLIEYSRGRMWIAAGNVVFFTEPLRYGLVNMIHGYIMYPERVTLLKSVSDGMYISSNATYFVSGEPQPATKGSTLKQTLITDYKAIEGAVVTIPSDDVFEFMYLSERGFMLASAGGTVKNLTEDQVAMDVMQRACMGLIERDGHQCVVAIARESTLSPLVSPDFIESEVERIMEIK